MESETRSAEDVGRADTAIWRYMDLPRFIAILSTSSLWFAKAATLRDDPYEGFGKAKSLKVPSPNDFPKWISHKDRDGTETKISGPEMMANMSQMSAKIVENARDHLYVNSWCWGASESMAMCGDVADLRLARFWSGGEIVS